MQFSDQHKQINLNPTRVACGFFLPQAKIKSTIYKPTQEFHQSIIQTEVWGVKDCKHTRTSITNIVPALLQFYKPLTVTEKVQSLVLPRLSVALYWIVWDPWLKRLPGAGPWLRDTVRPLGTLSVAVGTLQLTAALVTASSATTEMELGHELKLGAWVSDYKSIGNNQFTGNWNKNLL